MRYVLAMLAACVTPASEFPCASDADCSGGHCELGTSFCSFTDPDCPNGARYGDAAGSLSNTCVDGDVPVTCGNGAVDPGEDCDETSAVCIDCKRPTCGDGQLFANIEECDDKNTIDGDGCNANCLICPAGSVTHDNHCYWTVETARDWNAAGLDCAASHGYLAAIDDDAENTFVKGLTTTATDYWIGVTAAFLNGGGSPAVFFGEDGTRMTFFAWAANQPTANLNCGAMAQATGMWTSQDCGTAVLHPYVCERSPWTVSFETSRAYLAVTGRQRQQYAAAKTACPALPGAPHLATITDAAEQTLVDGITGASQTWIGADSLAATGTNAFAWVTGESFTFTSFAPTFPVAGAGDCIGIVDDGTWINRTCTSSRGYLCELELAP